MIITKFQGRLGNQMFQYAAALSISKKNHTFFLIDNSSKSVFFKYFKTRIVDLDFPTRIALKLFKKKIKSTIHQVGDEDITEMKKLFTNNSYYNGFFQSEGYFEGYKAYLQKTFVIKKEYKASFRNKYEQLFNENKIIAIHCRLGDYLNWGSDELGGENLTLPQSYYQNALSQIDQLDAYKIIIVTDDILNIEDRFGFITDKIIVSEDEIIDFQILQNANLLIISNSSFSWWAAYLNTNKALVYAPENWLGFKVNREYPIGILPDSFIKIPVF
jgi:hypothetical protein